MGLEQGIKNFARGMVERSIDHKVNSTSMVYDRKDTLDRWNIIKKGLTGITQDEIETTEERLEKAFCVYERGLPISEPLRGSAFFIQPRSAWSLEGPNGNSGVYYGDISDWLPALKNLSGRDRHDLFYRLPPFEVTQYVKDGSEGITEIVGAVVCVPLSVDKMNEALQRGGPAEVALYSRPVIYEAVRFARDKIGAASIGLGETMASMTRYGRKIEERMYKEGYFDVQVTTGHAGTVHLIDGTLKAAANLVGADLSKEKVGIIGCGSIGEASAVNLDGDVGGFVLSDIRTKKSHELMETLNRLYPGVLIEIAESNDELCRKVRFIIGAGSNLKPILNRDNIQPGTVIVDDSQPVTAWREEVEAANSMIVWPLGKMPENIHRIDYNFGPQGVMSGTCWGCEMELLTLKLTKNMGRRITSAVTVENVEDIGELVKSIGFGISKPLQSFGRPVTESHLEVVRKSR